jgi:CubicO group peptidase (beta-lactamase class C family)
LFKLTESPSSQQFIVASHLVAQLSNMSFPAFISSRIFAPLDMRSTYTPAESVQLSQAFASNGRRISHFSLGSAVMAGPGGAISSARDLATWMRLHLGLAETAEGAIPPAILDECMKARVVVQDTTLTYGMGWFQSQYRGHEVSP